MPATFVPLSPKAPGKPLPAPGLQSPAPACGLALQSFQPLPSPAPAVGHTPALAQHAAAPGAAPNPSITLHRENGQIARIRVQCACGQVIELECVY